MSLSTCTNTPLTTLLDTFIDLSACKRVTEVGLTHLDWDFEKLNIEVNSH
jgi:hypothetical protein